MSVNYRGMNKKELKDICRSDPLKYRGFSKLKKDDLSDKQRYIVSHKMDCLSKIN